MKNPVSDRLSIAGLLALALALFIAGAALAAPPSLTDKQFNELGERLMDIEWMRKPIALEKLEHSLKAQVAKTKDAVEQGRLYFLLGYLTEFRETMTPSNPKRRDYARVKDYYERAVCTKSGYALQAHYRLGVLGALGLLGPREASRKIAEASFRSLAKQKQRVWVRQRMPSKAPPAALTGIELAGAKSPDGGNRALLITSPAAKIEEGPVLQPFSMADVARRRLAALSGQNVKK